MDEKKRLLKVYSERIYGEHWLASCVDRALELETMKIVNMPFIPVGAFFNEAIGCYITGHFKGCIVLCRATLEAALKDNVKEKFGQQGSGLESMIDKYALKLGLDIIEAKKLANWGDVFAHADQEGWKTKDEKMEKVECIRDDDKIPFHPMAEDREVAFKSIKRCRKMMAILYPPPKA